VWVSLLLLGAPAGVSALAADEAPPPLEASRDDDRTRKVVWLDVQEYRIRGGTRLSEAEMQEALQPYLGPRRRLEEVEAARAALEKAYADRGWQAVTVAIPPQKVKDGVVLLDVTEGTVARLRVKGARWFLPSDVRRQAPSLSEGAIPNFGEVTRDIFLLNQLPDRRVTPALRAGRQPGTMEVDLNVEDRLPLHGSLELNDRHSAGTTPLRLNAAVRYDNLWQLGHTLSLSFQTAPQRLEDGKVFAGSYVARFPDLWWLALSLSAVVQDSDISTLGGTAVAGRGHVVGTRAALTIPSPEGWYQTSSVGVDLKEFEERLSLGGDTIETPITYWPMSVTYFASHASEGSVFQAGLTASFNARFASSSPERFDAKRYSASAGFVLYRGDLSVTQDLYRLLEVTTRLVGQWSPDPLVGSEQLAMGGLETVRGYLEAQALGDYGSALQLDLRSPSLGWLLGRFVNDLRFGGYVDAGAVGIHRALPGQPASSFLWSAGGGARIRLFGKLSGTVDVGVPLRTVATTARGEVRVHFRVWSEI
jgi:hemolysin activation/secretion protein